MADLRAARRYASALFHLSTQQGTVDAVAGDLDATAQAVQQNPALANALERPDLPAAAKKRLWEAIAGGQVQPLTLDFLRLLVDKRRADLVPAVRTEFQRLADEYRNLARAQVTTAVPLATGEREALAARLSTITGHNVQIEAGVDPAVMGGVVVRLGDTILDGSVRGYLESLRQQLLGNAGR